MAKLDVAGPNWQEMIRNLEERLELYRSSNYEQRSEIRSVLESAITQIPPLGSEDIGIAYLLGRLDEVDAMY